jgi:hypothetical protein
MHELEFFVKIAGKPVKVRMSAGTAGPQASFHPTQRCGMMGRNAVKSAYKISKENGDKAEKAWQHCADYCYYNKD